LLLLLLLLLLLPLLCCRGSCKRVASCNQATAMKWDVSAVTTY